MSDTSPSPDETLDPLEAGLLTVGDVVEVLRLSESGGEQTVRRFLRSGRLRSYRVGKTYLIARADLAAFIQASVVQPETRMRAPKKARPKPGSEADQEPLIEVADNETEESIED